MTTVLSYLMQMVIPGLFGGVFWACSYPWRRKQLRARGRRAGPKRERILLLYCVFLAGLLGLTLTPTGFWASVLRGEVPSIPPAFRGGLNLTPFHNSWMLLQYYIRHGMWDVLLINFPGNIVIFLPVGFCSALFSDRPRCLKSLLSAFCLSLFVESFQILVSRGTDIDDLILNTLGGLIGYEIFLLIRKHAPIWVKQCSID